MRYLDQVAVGTRAVGVNNCSQNRKTKTPLENTHVQKGKLEILRQIYTPVHSTMHPHAFSHDDKCL